MARYIDGFVIPVAKKKIPAYKRLAEIACVVWREHGALDYMECIGDDLNVKWALPFPKGIKTKPGETVVFSWIVYKSRAHRERVNAKVMKDPRIVASMKEPMPFDCARMLTGGFEAMVGFNAK